MANLYNEWTNDYCYSYAIAVDDDDDDDPIDIVFYYVTLSCMAIDYSIIHTDLSLESHMSELI